MAKSQLRGAVISNIGLNRWMMLAVILIVEIGILGACGVKTAPVPPKQVPPAQIVNLSARNDAGKLLLTWSLPGSVAEDDRLMPARFLVYRARTPLSDTFCPSCPQVFERVGEIPVRQDGQETYTYTERLIAGYRYTFKVTGYSKSGLSKTDSNEVVFPYEP